MFDKEFFPGQKTKEINQQGNFFDHQIDKENLTRTFFEILQTEGKNSSASQQIENGQGQFSHKFIRNPN